MHINLYMSFEYRPLMKKRWHFLARMPDLGADDVLFELLGADDYQSGQVEESECLEPKDWPDDVADESIAEDCYTVDDSAAESEISDILDNVRFCTKADAETWIKNGSSRSLGSGYRVTDPNIFGHSWLSMSEFEALVSRAEKYDSNSTIELGFFLAALKYLHEVNYQARVIYWFER